MRETRHPGQFHGRFSAPMAGVVCLWLALSMLALPSCGSSGAAKRPLPGATPEMRDIEPALRGIIGSSASLRGAEPLFVTGYGLVVGLNGTGSSDVPVNVRAYIEREMTIRGVGQQRMGFGHMTPSQLLNDPNTAVVLIQAAIPPGAPSGTTFDVLVTALPGSTTTSLEGGRLWTADLFRGTFIPGGPATESLAEASGQIFINPFADPARAAEDPITRTSGRILKGGVVKKSLDLALVLDNPSHARARSIVSAINAKFPQGPRDRVPTAIGRSEEVIELRVPDSHRHDTRRFVQLLLHMRLDPSFPQEHALRYSRAMKEQPELADTLAWCMQALGDVSIPYLRDLYDYAELTPRLAALGAGAGLGDPLVGPHLLELAQDGPPALRTQAIELLGQLDPDPQINLAMRELLKSEEMDVRIAAYEALSNRFDPMLRREVIEDKFVMELAPVGDPMLYVTQQGEPRIVVFGEDVEVDRPTFVSGWEDRLMLTSDSPSDDLRIYYRDFRTNRAMTSTVRPELPRLIEFLAHQTTPEAPAPGLNLTYSEVVGALHEIWKADGFPGVFVAQQDKLVADILRSTQRFEAGERPETSEDDPSMFIEPEELTTLDPDDAAPPVESRGFVVPLKKPGSPK